MSCSFAISGLLSKSKVLGKVIKFYVSSPWNSSIILVDLTSNMVSNVYMCCTLQPVRKCHRPRYLVTTPNGSLVASVDQGIIEIDVETGQVELLTHPESFSRVHHMIDGKFGQAQVYEAGPLTAVPGLPGLYVFADRMLHNLRVLDMSTHQFFSLCMSSLDAYLSPNSTMAMPSMSGDEILLPPCGLASPHTLLFIRFGEVMLISQTYNITTMDLQCEYLNDRHCKKKEHQLLC